VHLTLTTGLGKPAGLKNFEELHVPNMDHQGKEVLDVEWMVENWPKLWKIIGLDGEAHAYKWLGGETPRDPAGGALFKLIDCLFLGSWIKITSTLHRCYTIAQHNYFLCSGHIFHFFW